MVDEPAVDDRAQHATEQRALHARVRPQPEVREPRQLDLPVVDDDELLRALTNGALDRQRDDVLLLRHVCGDRHHDGRELEVPDAHAARRVAEHVVQPLDHAGAVVGDDVHVVRAHHDARELLGDVELLVRVARARDEAEALVPVRREAVGRGLERVFPRRLHELAAAADQRVLKAALVVHVVEPELALEAGLPQVHRRVELRDRADHLLPAVDLVRHHAADRALGADRLLRARGPLPLVVALHQRTDRADVDAGAAELAPGFQQRGAHDRAHEHLAGALGQRERHVAAQLVAGARAPRAHDAQVVVAVVEGVLRLDLELPVLIGQRRVQPLRVEARRVLELAPLVLRARHAPVVHVDVAQTDVLRTAQVHAVAGQTAVGVL